MTGEWLESLAVIDHKVLPPDPGVMTAIGLGHALHSALADLVDNSIDAQATNVLIRFVTTKGRLTSLLVVDDGRGMDADAIDAAMVVGRRREYDSGSLGHFGMGLKAASFSQADCLTVVSRREGGAAVGRRWVLHRAAGFECDVIDPRDADTQLAGPWPDLSSETGTVVRWDDVRTFPAARDPEVTRDFLSREGFLVRHHLGLVLHRLLEQHNIRIDTDVFETTTSETGPPQTVEPVDPFGYRRTGAAGYPKILTARVGNKKVPFKCHIWPGRSESPSFRLYGRPPDQFQGFYFYRNRRLLQGGDWVGAAAPHRRLQLARVAFDIEGNDDLFTMSMEKHSVRPRSELVRAVEKAEAPDGTTFAQYLRDAESSFRVANQRNRQRQAVVAPGKGLGPAIRGAIEDELQFVGGDPLDIRWAYFEGSDQLFEVDRQNRTLWLNKEYRSAILGGRKGSLNDAPLLKACLYLLLEDVFRGTSYGPRDKDNVELWAAVLTAAAKEEERA